jgi:glycosyltransferase involved in cell wall biosynthesis
MRVVIVSHTYFPSRYRGKLRWLATQGGVDLTLLALFTAQPPSRPLLRFEQTAEPFEVRFLTPVAFGDHNILRAFAPREVQSLVKEIRPDLVHVEAEPHSLTLALWAYLREQFGYRLVAFSWENLKRKGKGPLRWLERFSLRRVDAMVAGSRQAQDVLRWRGYLGPVDVIPQVGVDVAPFANRADVPPLYQTLPPGCRIGFIGRLVPEKGIMDLLAAFRPLAERAVLVFLGEGPLRREIGEQAARDDLAARILAPGFIEPEQIPAHLHGLDILVLPSRTTTVWAEQFGYVLVEAMAARVPVVGADSGAIPDVVGDAGLLYPEGDIGALTNCLRELLDDPSRRERLGQAGWERVRQRFSDEAIAKATLQVYRSVLGES